MEKKLGRKLRPDERVDHINRNKLDDRPENLRLCNHSTNGINAPKPSHNRSGYKGVSFYKRDKNWEAYIKYKQERIHLGRFSTKIEAAAIYNQAAKTLFKQFAYLNKI
jgi:hypothetical protein